MFLPAEVAKWERLAESDWPLQLLLKMEAVIEKECSALGGLFQVVIGDMKVSRGGGVNFLYHNLFYTEGGN